MNDKLMNCFTSPIKFKLLLDVEASGQTTAKELAKKNNHIPQATLYRYLRKMVDDGILIVTEERRVRNVSEKIYAVGIDYKAEVDKVVENNSGEGYAALFQQFCNGLLGEFKAYAARENIDILNDGSGFRVAPFYATADELKELAKKITILLYLSYNSYWIK